MNILTLKNINYTCQDQKILDIPFLAIEKGKIYGLVGPNGSGKTTLLSIMSLILKPTDGDIYFEDRLLYNEPNYLLTIGKSMTMVLQSPYLFNMSVAQNVAYGLRARKISKKKREAMVKEALELVGLTGFEKRKAKNLSGGETKLVSLARALVINPAILFLDEPTANVDSRHIHRFENIISQINKERGTTIVMTTHDLSEAYRLTDKVFSLFEGSFITSTIHNLLSGKLKTIDEGICFENEKILIFANLNKYNNYHVCNNKINHITIDPEDIIISQKPFTSSARNRFEGMITQIIDQGGKILLEVQSMERFKVFITQKSLLEMGLTIGSRVYLTFKASSVHIL